MQISDVTKNALGPLHDLRLYQKGELKELLKDEEKLLGDKGYIGDETILAPEEDKWMR